MKYIITIVTLLSLQLSQSLGLSDEKRLVETLLTDYAKVGLYGRPVASANETLRVRIGLTVIDLTVKRMFSGSVLLEVQGWLYMNWIDDILKWDPDLFGGVKDVRLPISGVWKPDIRLYNNFSPKLKMTDVLVKVENNGNVTWVPPCTFELLVTIDKMSQNIDTRFKFGSWTYDGFAMDPQLSSEEIDTSQWKSYDFMVIRQEAKKNVKFYPCCAEPYPDLTYSLHLKSRRSWDSYSSASVSRFQGFNKKIVCGLFIMTSVLMERFWC